MGTQRSTWLTTVQNEMSVRDGALVIPDDLDLIVVEEALAMLEGDEALSRPTLHCGTPVQLGTAVSDSFSSVDRFSPFTAESSGTTASNPKRKRSRDPMADANRRARQKAEREGLQQQVERYEQQLKTLAARTASNKAGGPVGPVHEGVGDSQWEEVARVQRRLCVASEELNHKLKSEVAANCDLGTRVGQMLLELTSLYEKNKTPSVASERRFQGTGSYFRAMPRHEHDLVPSTLREALAQDARANLRDVYLATDAVLGSFMNVVGVANANELFSTSRIRQDCGPVACVELLTSTPMPCGLQETVEVIWGWLRWKRRSNIPGFNYASVSQHITGASMEVHHDINFSGPYEAKTLNSVVVMEKREEADRMVLVFTTKTVQAAGSLGLCEKGWILVNRSPVDPLHKSIVRTCYRVAADRASTTTRDEGARQADTPTNEAFRAYVQRKLIKRMSKRLKELQCELLSATGRHELEALIVE